MKVLVFLAVVTLAYAKSLQQSETLSAYGYNRRVAIPLGEEIRKAEEALLKSGVTGRIAGGSSAVVGQFPYQAGVLTNFIGVSGTGVCGASLVTSTRLLHAAHCWFDGLYQGSVSEIVLGSTTLFFGGTRQSTSNIIMHPQWNPALIRDDVAVISLSIPILFSNTISPIALPSGTQIFENFVGESATASGYGRTGDTNSGAITLQQTLSFVRLNVISNDVCAMAFPNNVVDANICTSGAGGTNTCSGDSGGPLAITRNERPVLIGVVSFGSAWGCTLGFPAAFARVTSFMDFFNQYLN